MSNRLKEIRINYKNLQKKSKSKECIVSGCGKHFLSKRKCKCLSNARRRTRLSRIRRFLLQSSMDAWRLACFHTWPFKRYSNLNSLMVSNFVATRKLIIFQLFVSCLILRTVGKLQYFFENGECQNPLTRETAIGVIPLTFDINVLCKSLCDIFCGGKKMPFVVFGFITALFGKIFFFVNFFILMICI